MLFREEDCSKATVLKILQENPLALEEKLLWIKYKNQKSMISVVLFYPEKIKISGSKIFFDGYLINGRLLNESEKINLFFDFEDELLLQSKNQILDFLRPHSAWLDFILLGDCPSEARFQKLFLEMTQRCPTFFQKNQNGH